MSNDPIENDKQNTSPETPAKRRPGQGRRRTDERVRLAAERRKTQIAEAKLQQARTASCCKQTELTHSRASLVLEQTNHAQRFSDLIQRLLDSVGRVNDAELDSEPLTKRMVQLGILADKLRDFLHKPAPPVAINFDFSVIGKLLASDRERERERRKLTARLAELKGMAAKNEAGAVDTPAAAEGEGAATKES